MSKIDSILSQGNGGTSLPPVDLFPGQKIHGFDVKKITPIHELRAIAIELLHPRSGARLFHFYNDDPKNWIAISPTTPTFDDTGLQHILEHSVMAGTHNFPIKDVFFEIMKRSLATPDSTNAMNYIDHAFYYCSSIVKADLINLADVFFDCVFHPLLTEETFKREGHHLEPVDPNKHSGKIKINGIVYNEQKNALSSPEGCLYLTMNEELLPDTCYAKNSGGNSLVMPDLTYEEFKKYHSTYYHPSNSYFFFYGNMPTIEFLQFYAEKLNKLPRNDSDDSFNPLRPEITIQTKWDSPRIVRNTYPINSDESLNEKTYLMLSWLIGDATNPEEYILFNIINRILIGNSGAPLHKAILESKLGIDILINPLDGHTGPQTTFYVGLVGSEAEHVEEFTQLVLDTLTHIANNEIDKEIVETAFQQITYNYQEISPNFPFRIMVRVVNTWVYEKDPIGFLEMGKHLSNVRKRWDENPNIFNELIREWFLDNSHRLTVILTPDPDMQSRIDSEVNERLKTIRSQLSEEELKDIATEALELEKLNSETISPDDLAILPQIQTSDLPKKPIDLSPTLEIVNGRPILRNDIYANGVNYLVLNFDLQGLPQHLWKYLPIYKDAIEKLGTANYNYQEISRLKAATTGGIGCSIDLSTHTHDPDHSIWNLQFNIKALDDKIDNAFEILGDLIFNLNPKDYERLNEILKQSVIGYQNQVHGYGGPDIPKRHAARGINIHSHLNDILYGLPQHEITRSLQEDFDNSFEELCGHIEEIRDFILCKDRVTASFTGCDMAYKHLNTHYSKWIDNMRNEPIEKSHFDFRPFGSPTYEGITAPIQIAHCARFMPAPHYSHPDSILLSIGTELISFDYMLPEIRLKGNAYGWEFTYRPYESLLSQVSHFDPHISRTLDIFNKAKDYINQVEWTQTDIDRAIISSASEFLQYTKPSNASSKLIFNHLVGQSKEIIEERYAAVLNATPNEVKRVLLETIDENEQNASVCVIASRDKIETENKKMDVPLIIKDLIS
ncbi:insulinase family protein [Candidatus Poribacteria bacterium]|nr:insulinase family protein [Candidatus Poribacteria bacterium]